MIDMKILREQSAMIRDSAKAKGVELDVDHILQLDKQVRTLRKDIEQIAAEKNSTGKQIAVAEPDQRQRFIEEMRIIDRRSDELKAKIVPLEEELIGILRTIPNPASPDVTVSPNEDDNEVIRVVGEIPKFSFTPKDHLELGESLNIIDTERAAKVSGARFTYLKGDAVRLQFALIQYAFEIAGEHGFLPMIVPQIVNSDSMQSMGYLEHGGHDEIYFLQKDNQYLIGTSEQALGPMHGGEIFNEKELPLRYIGYSTCFRREAGSYGKDTRGILRVHQFDKVEMFSFTTPENGDSEHELILSIEEKLMQGLKIPYHVLKMVTGDLGLPAARKYDIEAWMPAQNAYRETHSCSTTTDFQARRLNTRYRPEGEKGTEFLHTVNGTAFAIGRTLIAILENFQNEDGSVEIPEVLQKYMGGLTRLTPHE